MKSFKGVIEKLNELLDPDKTKLPESRRKEYTHLRDEANHAQKGVQRHKKTRRHMRQVSQRANRG